MINLANLKNTHRPKKKIQRVGRGDGSGRGKTSGRGEKGDKSRSGYKRRYGKEGGQLPLYRKSPTRGFTRGRFIKESFSINLGRIEALYKEGETLNLASLNQKGLISKNFTGTVKILGNGELRKKVKIEAHHFSQSVREKLEKQGISFSQISVGSSAS